MEVGKSMKDFEGTPLKIKDIVFYRVNEYMPFENIGIVTSYLKNGLNGYYIEICPSHLRMSLEKYPSNVKKMLRDQAILYEMLWKLES